MSVATWIFKSLTRNKLWVIIHRSLQVFIPLNTELVNREALKQNIKWLHGGIDGIFFLQEPKYRPKYSKKKRIQQWKELKLQHKDKSAPQYLSTATMPYCIYPLLSTSLLHPALHCAHASLHLKPKPGHQLFFHANQWLKDSTLKWNSRCPVMLRS